MSYLDRKTGTGSQKVAEIKEWVRLALGIEEDAVIMAAELKCLEPDCPPLETRITIMYGDKRKDQYRWHKGLGEMELRDMAEIHYKKI